MTRLQADLALCLAGLIWGFGFVAQKDALNHIGPFTFVASRFLLSALVVLPLALREKGFRSLTTGFSKNINVGKITIMCGAFAAAVSLQQYGMTATSVTNTAFITGLYVVMVPFIGWFFYKQKLSAPVLVACVLSVIGVWLLSGGNVNDLKISLGHGDEFVLLCAIGLAVQVSVMGHLAGRVQAPFTLSLLQYLIAGCAALVLALCFETIHPQAIVNAWLSILFAGIASGGIAYTLQAVAQQHTPSAEAAIILSLEALFGGVGGVWILKEKITAAGIGGCVAIMAAIMLAELGPLLKRRRS